MRFFPKSSPWTTNPSRVDSCLLNAVCVPVLGPVLWYFWYMWTAVLRPRARGLELLSCVLSTGWTHQTPPKKKKKSLTQTDLRLPSSKQRAKRHVSSCRRLAVCCCDWLIKLLIGSITAVWFACTPFFYLLPIMLPNCNQILIRSVRHYHLKENKMCSQMVYYIWLSCPNECIYLSFFSHPLLIYFWGQPLSLFSPHLPSFLLPPAPFIPPLHLFIFFLFFLNE